MFWSPLEVSLCYLRGAVRGVSADQCWAARGSAARCRSSLLDSRVSSIIRLARQLHGKCRHILSGSLRLSAFECRPELQ